jgi:hypothetical protein
MIDEAQFCQSRYVNKQNWWYWAEHNPMQLHEKPLHSEKVTVWHGVSVFWAIGPYFFKEHNHAVTVTSECYCTMLQTF